jgi:hypothetical protein
MLRYSNRSIHGVIETSPSFYMWNPNNVSANYVDQFNDDHRSLLESLRNQAVAGGSLRKFAAAGNATAPNFQTLYAVVQCTPDLSEEDCNRLTVTWLGLSKIFHNVVMGSKVGESLHPAVISGLSSSRSIYIAWTTSTPTINSNKREGTANTYELHYFP